MRKLNEKELSNISGGQTGIAECIGRYTGGAALGAMGGSAFGPIGTAVGAGAGALTATPSDCKNN